jgi:hypothetical protein
MKFLVVGGGVAGVSCFLELVRVCSPADTITLVSAGPIVRVASVLSRAGRTLESLCVADTALGDFLASAGALRGPGSPNLRALLGEVYSIDVDARMAFLAGGGGGGAPAAAEPFDRLCVCTGAVPRVLFEHPLVCSVRDGDSVAALRGALRGARRALVVGNGGIALGLLSEAAALPPCELVWAAREPYIGGTFLSAGASDFLLARGGLVRTGAGGAPAPREAAAHWAALAEASCWEFPAAAAEWEDVFVTAAVCGDGGGGCAPLPPRAGRRGQRRLGCGAVAAEAGAEKVGSAAVAESAPPVGPPPTPPPPPPFPMAQGPAVGHFWASALAQGCRGGGGSGGGGGGGGARITLQLGAEVACVRDALSAGTPLLYRSDGSPAGAAGPPPLPPPSPPPWPLHVSLSNGAQWGVDCVVSPTGVTPCTGALPAWGAGAPPAAFPTPGRFFRGPDGGLLVNPRMQTTGSSAVFAAGDAATVAWPRARALAGGGAGGPPLWFQMRLWSQARVSGAYAARNMASAAEDVEAGDGGVAFELFSHVTEVLGLKLVLLGAFNGQGLGVEAEEAVRLRGSAAVAAAAAAGARCSGKGPLPPLPPPPPPQQQQHACSSPWGKVEVLLRVTPGVEFIQVVVVGGRVVGALLLGDTDLEETMENLILNKLDVRGPDGNAMDLLDPQVDLEDFFD